MKPKVHFLPLFLAVIICLGMFSIPTEVFAEEPTSHGYIEGIRVYASGVGILSPDMPLTPDFSTDVGTYEFNIPDGQNTYKIDVKIADAYVDNTDLYVKFVDSSGKDMKNPKEQKVKDKAINGVLTFQTATLFLEKNINLSTEPLEFSIVAGIKNGSDYSETDTYTFTVKRFETLKSLYITGTTTGSAVTGTAVAYDTVPSWNAVRAATNNCNTRDYSVVVSPDTEVLNIEVISQTFKDMDVYIAGIKVDGTTPCAINLSEFTPNDESGAITVPIKLVYTGAGSGMNTEYTLTVSFFDYSPVITKQPEPITCDKGEKVKLSVGAEQPESGGVSGELSYQWRYYNSDTARSIPNAISLDYEPDTAYAENFTYDCVVTNTVNGTAYSAISDKFDVNVNLTNLSPLVFARLIGPDYQREYWTGESIQNITYFVDTLDKDVREYNSISEDHTTIHRIYCNTVPSTEGGVEVTNYDVSPDISPGSPGGGIGYNADYGNIIKLMNATKFLIQALPQENPGTYYYYVVLETSYPGLEPVTTVSDFIEVKFKDLADSGLVRLKGRGTEIDPFLIESVTDLETLRQHVKDGITFAGQRIKMTKDLTLPVDWEPIGNLIDPDIPWYVGDEILPNPQNGKNVSPFSGIFNGDDHTVTIPEGGLPLFNYVRDASVKNLNIYGKKIAGAGLVDKLFVDYGSDGVSQEGDNPEMISLENVRLVTGSSTKGSGLLRGSGSGANHIRIVNCTIEKDVVVGYTKDVIDIGSFVGQLNGSIISSSSYADVYGATGVGGLAGRKGESMGDCSFESCTFQGNVTAAGNWVGGIVGNGYNNSTAPNTPTVVIKNCLVVGNISGGNGVGGIFGGEPGVKCAWGDESSPITDNVFVGQVSAAYESSIGGVVDKYVGGIIGYMRSIDKAQVIANNYWLDTCGAKDGIGGIGDIIYKDHPKYPEFGLKEKFVVNEACKSVTAKQLADGTVVKLLNDSKTSYKNWQQGEKYPYISDKSIAISLEILGSYKTNYYIGDALDMAGAEFTVTYSNGTTSCLQLADITISGYDNTKRGVQELTATYGAVSTTFKVTVLKPTDPSNPDANIIDVNLTLLGAPLHDSDADGIMYLGKKNNLETWIPKTGYEVDLNATVADVLKQALDANGMSWSNPTGNYVESITRNGVTLGEFTNGKDSGWVYKINGEYSLLGVAEQFLDDRDSIVFHYTDNWTEDSLADTMDPEGKWRNKTDDDAITFETRADGVVVYTGTIKSNNEIRTDTVTGKATVVAKVKAEDVKNVVADVVKAVEEARVKSENSGKTIVGEVKIDIMPESVKDGEKVTAAEAELTVQAVREIAAAKDVVLTIHSETADITLDCASLEAIAQDGKSDNEKVVIRVENIDMKIDLSEEDLTDAQKVQIEALKQSDISEGMQIIGLSVEIGGRKLQSLKGSAEVAVPYTPPQEMNTDDYDLLSVYYIDDSGKTAEISGSWFENGVMRFSTGSLSKFLISKWINPYADVEKGQWYYKNVRWVTGNGLMNGTDKGFEPNLTMTRAMFATVFWNLEGRPHSGTENPFTDVSKEQWYTDAVIWAAENGIVNGYGNGEFGPDDPVTREQMVTMLWRYAQEPSASGDLSKFHDADNVSPWAADPLKWAAGTGIISGDEREYANPGNSAVRAELAAVLQRYGEKQDN